MGRSVSIDKKNIKEIYKLTPVQEGMLAYYLQIPEDGAFFERLCVRMTGVLEGECFIAAWNRVVEMNDCLRTVFRWENIATPVQMVLRRHQPLLFFDQVNTEVLDLRDVPFWVELHRLDGAGYDMILNYHHIILDGWSSGIVLQDFFEAYEALLDKKEFSPPPKTPFKEYVSFLHTQDTSRQESFWKNYLISRSSTGRYPVKTNVGTKTGYYSANFGKDICRKIDAFNRIHKTVLSSLVYTAWGLVSSRYSDSREVLFDTTVSGRSVQIDGIRNMTGLLINTLPVYLEFQQDETLIEAALRVQAHLNERQEFETTPRSVIQGFLQKMGVPSPFDSVLAVENYPLDPALRSSGRSLRVEGFHIEEKTRHDVTVLVESGTELTFAASYDEELFDAGSISVLFDHLGKILETVLDSPSLLVGDILTEEMAGASSFAEMLSRRREECPVVPTRIYVAPRDNVEARLAGIWAAILNIDASLVGIDNDFFEFGGHSLKASTLALRIRAEFGVKVSLGWIFEHPTIRRERDALGDHDMDSGVLPDVVPREVRDYYPVSSAQERLYFLWQLDRNSLAYNSPVCMTIKGDLDTTRLQSSISMLVQNHETLRTSFVLIDGRPHQRVISDTDCKIEARDIPSFEEGDHSPLEQVIRHFIRPFDLGNAPLIRATVATTGENDYLLAIDMHHIAADGISRDILTAELMRLYSGEIPAANRIQYRDFCLWQKRRLDGAELQDQKQYWLDLFAGELPDLNLATDFPRPAIPRYCGKRLRFDVGSLHVDMLRHLMEKGDATLFMVFLALLDVVLGKYCRQDEVVVGTAVAGRQLSEIANTAGLFLETLALKGYPRDEKVFLDFLTEVRECTIGAFANQDYPFRELLKDLGAGISLNRNPLFDVMLIVQNHQRLQLQLPGMEVRILEFDPGIAKLDITFEVFEQGNNITVELEYDTHLYREESVKRMWRHVTTVLEHVHADERMVLGNIGLLTEMERSDIAQTFNTALEESPCFIPVLRQLLATAAAEPHRVALTGPTVLADDSEEIQMTYGELIRFSRYLAGQLKDRGVKEGDIVSVSVNRSVETIAALAAIWLAGAAYLPVDCALPPERRRYLVNDSSTGFSISCQNDESFAETTLFIQHKVLEYVSLLADDPELTGPEFEISVKNQWPAYIIYTSGSTGRPKGVSVTHGNLAANIGAFLHEFDISCRDVVVQQASVSFDTFGEEVYPVLLRGGNVTLPTADDIMDAARLSAYIARRSATVLDCSPLLLNELNNRDHSELASLRIIISGGDVLRRDYIDGFLRRALVYNTYGPTESTICATYHRCRQDDGDAIPIGKPIANYRVYILDRNLRLSPVGIPGELCVTGPGVTQGYLNNPELTADRFVDIWERGLYDLHHPGGDVMYRTGDLARWLPDGSIEYIGRIDQQVKIRGFRIELGEIEHRLLKHEAVKEVCVLARQDRRQEKYLTAYIVFRGQSGDQTVNFRDFLSRALPDYMIPAFFIPLAALPHTSSGKIDRRALPEPSAGDMIRTRRFVAPGNEKERRLAAIWEEILAIDSVGVEDNFFELGGDSILANRVVVKIRDNMGFEISLRDFFQQPSIGELSRMLPEEPGVVQKIPRVSRDRKIPLSFPQERLWFLQQLDTGNRSYHVPRALRVKGEVNVALFEQAFSEIVRRHEIFRTIFPMVDGEPVQQIQPPYRIQIPVIDLSDVPEEEVASEVEEFIMDEGQREFYLVRGPMLRVSLLKLGEDDHVLVTAEHHLVHDGWTQGVLLNEFIQIYSAFVKGEASPLPEPPIQYADFAVWQRETIRGQRLEKHLDFWEKKLRGAQPLLDLPTDFSRPQIFSGDGDLHRFVIPADAVSRLKRFCHERTTTLFITMLAVFKLLLYRYSHSSDICLGTGIANRSSREMDGMMGMVVNTIALRTEFSPGLTFIEFLDRIKETCVEAYEHEETPFDKVVERLSPKRSLSYSPVFQVMFSFMDTPTKSLELPGLELSIMNSHNRSSKFDISVVLILPRAGEDLAGEILVDWEYSTDLFTKDSMARMGDHYMRLLEETLRTPDRQIYAFDFLDEGEKRQLLADFNDNDLEFDRGISLIEPIKRQAALHPHRLAAVSGSREISYKELDDLSSRLAGYLKTLGVKAGNPVGVMMDRSIDMVIGLTAILKTGGFYLPIDIFYPKQRKNYFIEDAGVMLCLTDGSDHGLDAPDVMIVDVTLGIELGTLDNGAAILPEGGDPAYAIYTSGSTGAPKGVVVEHRQVNNCISWMQGSFPLSAEDRVVSRTNLTFDPSVWEIFWPLSTGASVNVFNAIQSMDVEFLIDFLAAGEASVMYCPASLFSAMTAVLKEKKQDGWGGRLSLRWFFIGAEPVRMETIKDFYTFLDGRIVNTYGPTECTINNTFIVLDPGDSRSFVPIGKPVANNKLYILGNQLQLLPRNVAGEICIAGESLARGYVNSVEKTAQAFIPNPFGEGRLYRTGDLGRWLADGNIEILGRIDKQLKIRGYRVEPAEIQNRLIDGFEIDEVFVTAEADETGAKRLVAYLVADSPQDRIELRRYLADKLPEYMVPSDFVQVDGIPLTSNGKVDIQALQKCGREPSVAYSGPRSTLEERLLELWRRILKVEPNDLNQDSNFFENGGHSLSVIRLVSLLHQELNVAVPVSEVFMNPTFGGLLEYIKQREGSHFVAIENAEEKEYYPLTPPQRRLFFLQQLDPLGTAYNIPIFTHIKGPLDREKLVAVLQKLVMRHESLRTYFVTVDGEPVQRIAPVAEVKVEYSELPGAEVSEFLSTETRQSLIKPFNLSEAPLLRVGLARLSDNDYVFMVDLHHIITDGASTNIVIKDFITLYTGGQLAELSLRYRDYAEWVAQYYSKKSLIEQENFWLGQFSGPLPQLILPLDYERSAMREFDGETYSFKVLGETVGQLNRLIEEEGVTLYILCLAIYYVLLFKLSGQEDIVVGTDTAGRNHAHLNDMIGLFINTLALRNFPQGKKSFRLFLRELKERAIKSFDNQDYPFERLVERISVNRDLNRNPLFDAAFYFHTEDESLGDFNGLSIGDLHVAPIEFKRDTAKFDLMLSGHPAADCILFTFEFSRQLFKPEKIEHFSLMIREIISEVCLNKDVKLGEINVSLSRLAKSGEELMADDIEF